MRVQVKLTQLVLLQKQDAYNMRVLTILHSPPLKGTNDVSLPVVVTSDDVNCDDLGRATRASLTEHWQWI